VAHVHDHHAGGTTIIESDREGPATALMVLIGLIMVGVLVWFFAFSGVVFNRGDNGTDININRNDNPPAQQNNDTNTDTGTNPNPVPS
jgi:hypothetical protein